VTSRSSKLLHIDPLAIALEKRKKAEEQSSVDESEKSQNRLSNMSSQPILALQPNVSSQPNMSWQPSGPPPGGPLSNQPRLSSQPRLDNHPPNPLDLLTSLPEIKGETRMPHPYTDHLCRLLKPDEQAVYFQLYRLSWGWNQETCFISNPRLSERSNVPLSSMKRAVTGLITKGLIEKTGHKNGFGQDQGVEYRLPNLSNQPNTSSQPNTSWQPNMDTIKVNNTYKEHTHTGEADQANTASAEMRVGVGGSKFTAEECRRYAKHLQTTGQGINNPGGYATTIFRTGEADEDIAAFLSPVEPSPTKNTSECPDCQGSGFWYPNGTSGGVAKCKHANLKKGSST
jgi:hypothetical protein